MNILWLCKVLNFHPQILSASIFSLASCYISLFFFFAFIDCNLRLVHRGRAFCLLRIDRESVLTFWSDLHIKHITCVCVCVFPDWFLLFLKLEPLFTSTIWVLWIIHLQSRRAFSIWTIFIILWFMENQWRQIHWLILELEFYWKILLGMFGRAHFKSEAIYSKCLHFRISNFNSISQDISFEKEYLHHKHYIWNSCTPESEKKECKVIIYTSQDN